MLSLPEEVLRRVGRFRGGDRASLGDLARLRGGEAEWLSPRPVRLGGGDIEWLGRRPRRGGEAERDRFCVLRRGGVTDLETDLDTDLDKVLPLGVSLCLPLRGGVREIDRLRSRARVRDGEREREYEDPVYDE